MLQLEGQIARTKICKNTVQSESLKVTKVFGASDSAFVLTLCAL